MGISQYHMNYSRDEDRIFVFVRDGETTEHAFGLTRQLFKKLWPVLGKTVQDMSDAARRTVPKMKNDVLAIEQQGAVSDARETGALTNNPVPGVANRFTYLVTTIRISDAEGGGKLLTLSDGAQAMNIPIGRDRLIVFSDALRSLVAKSDWDINPLYPWQEPDAGGLAEPAAAPPADSEPTRH